MNRQEQPQGDQQDAADHAGDCSFGDGGILLVGQRHATGDPHPCVAGFDELKADSGGAHCLGGGSARLKLRVIELGLRQDEFVLAAEIGELPAEQPLPRQRAGMADNRVGYGLVKTA